MLSTEVHSKELGFGKREGDIRGNTMIRDDVGTYGGTQMIFDGKEGYDTYKLKLSYTGQRIVKNTKDTHIVQSQDAISDADLDGKIIIDTGSQDIILSGNALPKTGVLGEVIAGEWTLDGLNLLQDGNDLIVTKLGVKLADFKEKSNPLVSTITIKNFPFSNSRGGFGITLGKKKDPSLGDDVYSLSLTNSYLTQGAFAVASSDKGLFGPLAMLDSQGAELPVSHKIGVFDSFGNQLATHDVESVIKSSADSAMLTPDIGAGIKIGAGYYGNGFVAYPISELAYLQYTLETGASRTDLFSRVGAIVTDTSGNVLGAQVYANTNSRTQEFGASVSGGSFKQRADDPQGLYYLYTSQSGSGDQGKIVYKVDPTSLATIGDKDIYSAFTWVRDGVALYQNPSNQPDVSNFNLANGARIAISNSGKTITSSMTKLRDMFPSEITPNYDLASGSQATNSQLDKQILTLGEATTLEVAANPNSVAAILNLDPATNPNSRLTFSAFDSSQVTAYATDSSQYSFDDILSGSVKTSDMQLVYGAAQARRLTDSAENISPYFSTLDVNSTYYYDEFSYGSDDSVLEEDDELPDLIPLPYTMLELPSNQTVVLVGVNGTELAKSPHSFFLTSENITQSPTSQPTSNPSTQPSTHPSGHPTYLPTIGEVIMPTTKPSSQTTANPSQQLTSNPTSQPSSNPTLFPTKSTRNPSSQPTHHPIAGDLAVSPTSQPSGNPSLHPRQSPSFKPQAIPSFKPTQQPAEQIRSENPTTENLRTARPTTFDPITTIPTIANTDLETGFVTKYPTSLPTLKTTQLRQGTNSSPNFMETPGGIGVAVGAALLLTAAGLRWLFRKGEPRVNPENANAVGVVQTRGGREN